ncbi:MULTISPECIES: AraC family transcriptional regulator [unclassified Methylobacterium]|jgi:AraC-like DNA-binding protein|uniref:AraC family transcriptional regulator n=1 Tax=unclassified Methylobacterium TaxID=2615210 RepID=UPI00136F152B|nr:helix-turn-helix transcriptional regulator [Methylobacterium sp. 2A]
MQPAPDRPPDIVCARRDYPDGFVVGPHCHAQAQLIYATAGVMEIRAAGGLWLVPPQRALWVDAGVAHALRARGTVSLRTLYLDRDAVPPGLPEEPASLVVSPLLRALILRAVESAGAPDPDGRHGRLLGVLIDEIAILRRCPLQLALPTEPRLRRACEAILADPGGRLDMAALAARAGTSERTLARLAERDLGLPFSLWRQQARILAAPPILAGGGSVTEAALSLGYASPSAFAGMFRRLVGAPPSAFQAARLPSRPSAGSV